MRSAVAQAHARNGSRRRLARGKLRLRRRAVLTAGAGAMACVLGAVG
jgi:hypothetical protein